MFVLIPNQPLAWVNEHKNLLRKGKNVHYKHFCSRRPSQGPTCCGCYNKPGWL